MKPNKESATLVARNKYTAQFKEQALERADRDGVPKGSAEQIVFRPIARQADFFQKSVERQ